MSNPITAIITAITVALGVGVMAFANYRAEMSKMKDDAVALNKLSMAGVKNNEDYEKATKTSNTAEKKLNENKEIKKMLAKLDPRAHDNTTYKELLSLGSKPNTNGNRKKVIEIAKKLGITIPKNAKNNNSTLLAREVEGSVDFNSNKNGDKIIKLQKKLTDNKKWLDKNGYKDKNNKEIEAENKRLKFVSDSYSKLQNWQKKYSNGGKFSTSDKASMTTMKNGIDNLNAERANIIKLKPNTLKDKSLIALANLPYDTLNNSQKKKVNYYKKVAKEYYNSIKRNTDKYKNYGVTKDTSNLALGVINPILKPNSTKIDNSDMSKKIAIERKKIDEALKKSILTTTTDKGKKDPIAAIKSAVEAQLIDKQAQIEQLLSSTGNISKDIANLNKAKGVLKSEKAIYKTGLANLKATTGVTQDDINSYNKALADIDTKTKGINTDITKLMTQDKLQKIKNKYAYFFIDFGNKVDTLLSGSDGKDGNDMSRLKQALKAQKTITKKYATEYNDYAKAEGKMSDDALQAYQNKLDSSKKEKEIQNKIADMQKGSTGIGVEILNKLNRKLMDSIAPISAESDKALKAHQQKLKSQIGQPLDKMNLDFSGNKLFNSTFWNKLVSAIAKATSGNKGDVTFNVSTTNNKVAKDITKELKYIQYLGVGGVAGALSI